MNIDVLLTNGQVYNSYLKKFVAGNIAVSGDRFAYVGTDALPIAPQRTIDLAGQYVIPGLIDCHMHIESTMCAPRTFMNGAARNGVTTLIAEPHEIANVFGLAGIRALMQTTQNGPCDVRIAIPSSVPSTNETLETAGAAIENDDVEALMHMEQVICLGEVMDCRAVLADAHSKTNRLIRQIQHGRPDFSIEGHCPRFVGWELAQLLYRGIRSDHTDQSMEGLAARAANGMFIQLQEKTLKKEFLDYLMENRLSGRFALVTDDTMPDDFVRRGQLNHLVQRSIELGLAPEEAIYAATYAPAQHMGLRDKGAIAPGRIADFVVLSDLRAFAIESVWHAGAQVFARGEAWEEPERDTSFPAHFYHSVHLSPRTAEDFVLRAPIREGTVLCRILAVQEHTTFVAEGRAELPVRGGVIDWESSPYNLACVFERHGKNGGCGMALIGGTALTCGAAATTYAHDSHNLLVLGQTAADMQTAANTVIEAQGGFVAVRDGHVEAFAPLPIAGILSDRPLPVLGEQIAGVRRALTDCGYRHDNVIMSLSTLSLPVSPYFKLTDKGIIDVKKGAVAPLILETRG
ncbi:adenine deaminase C-terminal domain-containing protein [Selenomonas sp. oral taxon 138]|uniref:adenine deaminase C-terminal domain-containing protein n=1 Tax=Selenomonas sp. oral taxon 138 TaxID=712532 RepID=UPI0002A1D893|nr:adenine deaminase C-terminal domain-containing protein [Selenomonas sp. oral taxon 138]EKX97651.1 putative adenine deaminase [Selenomonas sp. oral taxon 138 str. F0429]